ncbi:MAG: hypothetical protein C4335_01345 [Armatimonadota bacterium]
MELTVFDLDATANPTPRMSEQSERMRPGLALAIVCLVGGIVLLSAFIWRARRPEAGVLQQSYLLPAPQPLSSPRVFAPVAIISPSPAPQVVQIPPPRPSLWEIRAQLKRGLGEWEFPHYANAPEYGSGPDSSAPSLLKPHLAVAPLR